MSRSERAQPPALPWRDRRRPPAHPRYVTAKRTPVSERTSERVADTMFALSTPSRVQILGCLMDGPHAVVDIMKELGMEQSAVSHQLRVLRDHGLVKGEKKGRHRLYALSDEHVLALLEAALDHTQHRSSKKVKAKPRSADVA